MSIYADTSFFVSIYLSDRHTPDAKRLLASRPTLWMTPLHVAEWVHAIGRNVFLKSISRTEGDRFLQLFQEHRANRLWNEVDIPEEAFETCAQLARQYAGSLGTRTLDTLHVAIALELRSERFWTFDDRQKQLVRAVGLKLG